MRRMYHMSLELMPYIYSSVWQTHSTMVPLNRPMYIDYGSDDCAYENEQEFLSGISCSPPRLLAGRKA